MDENRKEDKEQILMKIDQRDHSSKKVENKGRYTRSKTS